MDVLKQRKVPVDLMHFGVFDFFGFQKTGLGQSVNFPMHIGNILIDQAGDTPDTVLIIRKAGKNNDNFTPDPGCYKKTEHNPN